MQTLSFHLRMIPADQNHSECIKMHPNVSIAA